QFVEKSRCVARGGVGGVGGVGGAVAGVGAGVGGGVGGSVEADVEVEVSTEPLIPCSPAVPSEHMANINCSLETKELWDKFHELGTEMIITKSGRCDVTDDARLWRIIYGLF
ncbi:T-box transcription factor TBX20, partial [Silurus meridionalis]